MREVLKFLGLGIGAAVLYGIVQDQITIRVCPEYFTVAHPRVFATDSLTWLALGWGVIATWWVGAPLGLLLALAARAGRRPRIPARRLLRPVGVFLAVLAGICLLAGITGYVLGELGVLRVVGPLSTRIPASRHTRFLAALWAHLAAYGAGGAGGVGLAVWTWRRRRAPPDLPPELPA